MTADGARGRLLSPVPRTGPSFDCSRANIEYPPYSWKCDIARDARRASRSDFTLRNGPRPLTASSVLAVIARERSGRMAALMPFRRTRRRSSTSMVKRNVLRHDSSSCSAAPPMRFGPLGDTSQPQVRPAPHGRTWPEFEIEFDESPKNRIAKWIVGSSQATHPLEQTLRDRTQNEHDRTPDPAHVDHIAAPANRRDDRGGDLFGGSRSAAPAGSSRRSCGCARSPA